MTEFLSTKPQGDRLKKETAYYETHQEELLGQYPEQWIAILDEKVIGGASDPRQLLFELKNRGVSLRRVLVKHLTRKEEVWVLLIL